ncbi:AbaSI family restriction endonuclease [Porphyrobacter sp. AAP60]|uniref:AbaSI family restriction endonuclease n=1 Tax=Porphyrobacter sp. AAP60 TaxID=1523423 RepID=UPI0006B91CC4|nr:hypothetical protein [Porphyrobacter sp. AAP60]KPF64271.1 hypothetical protein IP79_05940 [Porphyrobacter sp. AAP60]
MTTNKTNFILKSLRKISHKGWELFVISRIIHKLDDPEIEIVTQQLVRLPNGKRALTDLYFPQFGIHIEVDEGHHFQKNAEGELGLAYVPDDEMREQDIVQITGHEVRRIPVVDGKGAHMDYSDVAALVDVEIDFIRSEKQVQLARGLFEPWDFESRYDPQRIIEKGSICVADNVLFRRQVDALRCFGFTGVNLQRGVWTIPDGSGDTVWFPRLYRHDCWLNELTDGGKVIYERAMDDRGRSSIQDQRRDYEKNPDRRFIVFAKGKDALGANLLRYVGVFKPDLQNSTDEVLQFNLVQDEIKVRQPQRRT